MPERSPCGMKMAENARLKAYHRGHRAEWLAALSMVLKGFRIVARRYKTPVGEVDLIVRKRNLVVFIEVKARPDTQSALDSISRSAQRRIEAAGEWWITKQKDGARLSWRFDVIAVSPWRWPVHFEDVW